MWVSYSGKKKTLLPRCPTFPGTDTRVYNQRDTHHFYRSVWLCHHPNLLHKHTGLNTKTHSYTHKIRSSCAGRATKASLPWGGGGDWVSESLCVFNGKQLDQIFLLLSMAPKSVMFHSYPAWQITLTIHSSKSTNCCDNWSSGSSHSSQSHWKISDFAVLMFLFHTICLFFYFSYHLEIPQSQLQFLS